jgi:hypothetical protein
MPFFLQLPSSSTPLPEQQSLRGSVLLSVDSPSAMHSVGSEGDEGAELGAPPVDGAERGAPPELVARGEPPMAEAGP